MLAIARTLAGNPKAILLDEPSEGLAPLVVNAVIKAIEELKRAGMTILLAEQSLRFAERVADRVYKVEKGRLA
jgi:branched-chain amino acid transport system ATP-binding protein